MRKSDLTNPSAMHVMGVYIRVALTSR